MSREPNPAAGPRSSKTSRNDASRSAQAGSRKHWARRFAVGVAAWLLPVAVVWVILTPYYNNFLTKAAERLVRLTERPAVTRLHVHDPHHLVITRTDYSIPGKPWLYSIRTTDTHFPLIMLGAFFLAVPGIGWRKRLENLGWAVLISVFFHIVSLFFRVKFVYATQLGAWSIEHYGSLGRNFWGLSSHLLEVPFKFALPFVLWAAFYVRLLLPDRGGPTVE